MDGESGMYMCTLHPPTPTARTHTRAHARARARAHTHSTVILKTYLLKGSLLITFIRTYSTVTTHNTTVKN